jgi:hypothetical protein
MKVTWHNDALCLRPETDTERQALAAIVLNDNTAPSEADSWTGQEPDLQHRGIEDGSKPCGSSTFHHE